MTNADLAAVVTPIVVAISLGGWIAAVYYADLHPAVKHPEQLPGTEVSGGAFEARQGGRQLMPIPGEGPMAAKSSYPTPGGIPAQATASSAGQARPAAADTVPAQRVAATAAESRPGQPVVAGGETAEQQPHLVPGSKLRLTPVRGHGTLHVAAELAERGQPLGRQSEIRAGHRQRRHAGAIAVEDRRGHGDQADFQFTDGRCLAVAANLGQFALQRVSAGDGGFGVLVEPGRQRERAVGQQHLAVGYRMRHRAAPDPAGRSAHDEGAGHLGHVQNAVSVRNGEVDGLAGLPR